ncbi:twin arginine translocation system, TatB family protein [Campylobacter iguaniorum]|uniref:Sec-independent protein translocase protein TatB n=1 Tax=Campylobacter iguaniorum TaxID=1244531 RepID=UPI0007C89A20|nr:Sec-independent protein translocase protein TatB [Campylobacter iguaniorum]ANE36132.1 twin arginine translocation system, TatB family protein [Campylobacter iguaniorum]
MFGMSFPEIIIVAVVAVIFLGPDKLPDAMVKIAKFFKVFKQTVNSAKSTFEQEVKIAELKEDAKKYKENFTEAAGAVRKKLTFEELDELKNTVASTKDGFNESLNSLKDELNIIKDPLNSLNSEVEFDHTPKQAQTIAQTTPATQPNANLETKKEA